MEKFLNLLFGSKPSLDLYGYVVLERARIHLEQYGNGTNNEYLRARNILLLAQQRVVNEN